MPFDPDKYLENKGQEAGAGFDPDAYLQKTQPAKEFDPDAYLENKPPVEPKDTSVVSQVIRGVSTPFQEFYEDDPEASTRKKFSAEIMEKARKELEEKGYDPEGLGSKLSSLYTAFADEALFGNRQQILAAVDSALGDESYEERLKVYEAMDQIRGQDAPISDIAGTLAAYITPHAAIRLMAKAGIKAASKLGGLFASRATPAAIEVGARGVQGLASLSAEAEEGRKIEAASRGVAEGVALSAAFKTGGKVIQAIKKGGKSDEVAKTAKRSGMPDEEADRLAASYEQVKQSFDQELKQVSDLSEEQVKEFKNIILAGKTPNQYASQRGDLDDALDSYRSVLARRKSLADEDIVDRAPKSTWTGKNLMFSLADAQFAMNSIDRKLGTNLMPKLNELSRKYNLAQHKIKEKQIASQQILDNMKSKTRKYSSELINKIESGVVDQETQPFIKLFEDLREDANRVYGSEVVKKLRNKKTKKELPYVPHYTASAAETRAKLRNRIKDVTGKQVSEIQAKDLDKIKADKELMDSYNYLGGYKALGKARRKKGLQLSDPELKDLIVKNDSIGGLSRNLKLDAASAEMRLTEEIPDLIREKDIGKLLNSWINGLYSDAFMGKDIRGIRVEAEGIREADKLGHSYLLNLLADVTGGKRDSIANWAGNTMRKFESKVLEKAVKLDGQGQERAANFYRNVSQFPRFMQAMQANMYPYFLGLRADAVVRNLAQPYAMTATAVNAGNPAYTAKLAANGAFGTISDIRSAFREDGEMYRKLVAKGWQPPDPTPGAFVDLQRGLKDSGAIKRGAGNLNRRLSDFAMYAYTKSDVVNRVATVHMGETVAQDAIKKSKAALNHIDTLPPAYRRRAKAALKAGNKDELSDVVTDHLIATTQFNYNKISMSNYGRFFGGAFKMFSKWPTAIGADIYDTVRQAQSTKLSNFEKGSKATRDLTRKYFGPMIVAMMGDYLIHEGRLAESTLGEERYKELMGRSISSAMPLASVQPLLNPGRAFSPPVYEALLELSQGDPSTFMALVPGAVYVRFATERLPRLIEDREGESPVEAFGLN